MSQEQNCNNTVLVIGAGGVAKVAAFKLAKHTGYNIHIASRSIDKPLLIKELIKERLNKVVTVSTVDASDKSQLLKLLSKIKPKTVLHLGLPYHNLVIMDACLEIGCNYIDTACYEDETQCGTFSAQLQWDKSDQFKEKGILGLVSAGLTPGWSSLAIKYTEENLGLETIESVEIYDANASTNSEYTFSTNFSPLVNLDEINNPGKYWSSDKGWVTVQPFSIKEDFAYPEINQSLSSYLIYHEEQESIVKNYAHKGLKSVKNFMTFGDSYIKHLEVFNSIGLLGEKGEQPITINGVQITPKEFLGNILPDPSTVDFASHIKGVVEVAVVVQGKDRNGTTQKYCIYNIKDIEECFAECQAQGVSWNTAIPAVASTIMVMDDCWVEPGVWNTENMCNTETFFDIMELAELPNKIIKL